MASPNSRQPALLARIALALVHFIYCTILIIKCILPRRTPKSLVTPRRTSPGHVALLLHVDPSDIFRDEIVGDMIECVRTSAEWCRTLGVETLTIYDERGILKQHNESLPDAIPDLVRTTTSTYTAPFTTSASSYPMTPPPSDGETTASGSSTSSTSTTSPVISFILSSHNTHTEDTDSDNRSSNTLRRRGTNSSASQNTSLGPLRVNLICREQGKPAIARATQQLAFQRNSASRETLNAVLEAEFPPPDLLLVHPLLYPSTPAVLNLEPMELHGFPPWQIRLTEIWYDPLPPARFFSLLLSEIGTAQITELDFRRALDQFALVEVKVGK